MQTVLNTAARLLVVIPSFVSIDNTPCLLDTHLGTYGEFNLYAPTEACSRLAVDAMRMAVAITVPQDTTALVWVEEVPFEEDVLSIERAESRGAFESALVQLQQPVLRTVSPSGGVAVEDTEAQDTYLLFDTPTSALIAFAKSAEAVPLLSEYFPPHYKTSIVPHEPIRPTSDDALAPLRTVLANLKYDSSVDQVVNNLTTAQIKNDIRYLTGEDSESPITSRFSVSRGAFLAADWLKENVEAQGAECELWRFLTGFAPDVIW